MATRGSTSTRFAQFKLVLLGTLHPFHITVPGGYARAMHADLLSLGESAVGKVGLLQDSGSPVGLLTG